MDYKKIKRLTELVYEYHWYDDEGLIVFVPYYHCKELFTEVCQVDFETYPECKACENCIAIPHFEEFLECYTNENIEDIFPKEAEK